MNRNFWRGFMRGVESGLNDYLLPFSAAMTGIGIFVLLRWALQ